MNDIMINTERKYSATVIPNVFIDRYLASANGAYVKIYLYLLRCLTGNEMQFSISSAADFFDETESDIIRALKYWDKNDVIRLYRNGDDITGITLLDLTAEPVKTAPKVTGSNAKVISINNIRPDAAKSVAEEASKPEAEDTSSVRALPSLSRADINKALEEKEVNFMSNALEMYLQRTLSEEDQNLLVNLYKNLGFSQDLILHLYEICIDRNKKKNSYIWSTALDWYEQGITTVEEADNRTMLYNAYFNAVNKAFNLGRLPGDKEQKFIRAWEGMGFSPEMVKEACDRTLLKTNKTSFVYADKILTSWNEENIKTPEALAEKDRNFTKAKGTKPARKVSKSAENYLNRYTQREYSASDMREIERQMLERSLGFSIKQEQEG